MNNSIIHLQKLIKEIVKQEFYTQELIREAKEEHNHLVFFDTTKELLDEIFSTVENGDYVIASTYPMWVDVKEGIVSNIDKKGKTITLTNEDKIDFNHKEIKQQEYHGCLIEKNGVFTKQKGLVEKYGLGTHPRGKLVPKEKITKSPGKDFLEFIKVGDHLTIWSHPDERVKNFLHLPVQGWMKSKNLETKEIEHIHPPNMEFQKFKITDDLIGFGYYRKIIFQLKK